MPGYLYKRLDNTYLDGLNAKGPIGWAPNPSDCIKVCEFNTHDFEPEGSQKWAIYWKDNQCYCYEDKVQGDIEKLVCKGGKPPGSSYETSTVLAWTSPLLSGHSCINPNSMCSGAGAQCTPFTGGQCCGLTSHCGNDGYCYAI
jgi:hypothetical protein